MRKLHLIWIIPLTIIISGLLVGCISLGAQSFFYENYPIMSCIYMMENAMNVDSNILPVTKESQRRAIEYRCAIEVIPNITQGLELDDIWVIE